MYIWQSAARNLSWFKKLLPEVKTVLAEFWFGFFALNHPHPKLNFLPAGSKWYLDTSTGCWAAHIPRLLGTRMEPWCGSLLVDGVLVQKL